MQKSEAEYKQFSAESSIELKSVAINYSCAVIS